MAIKVRLTDPLRGVAWQRFHDKVQQNLLGAREMARIRFLIGSSLPYASHWIEEGWRNDPRFGVVHVLYRTPATNFLRDAGQQFGVVVRTRRPGLLPIGVVFNGRLMQIYAQAMVEQIRTNLNNTVYNVPVPIRNGRARYLRSHQLYNSIKAARV